jgi:hypothetical protein
MIHFLEKLKSMLTAISYAEAGDFDLVKQVLRERSDEHELEDCETKGRSNQPVIPAM